MAAPKVGAQAHALVTYYDKAYVEKYGVKPVVNRYSARYGFDAILMDIDVDEVKSLIDYYMETASRVNHALPWFFNNYDKLISAKVEADRDRAETARLREESKQRAEEWRNRVGNKRTETD